MSGAALSMDLNKIYEPMRQGMSLKQLAVEINALIAAEEDTRLALALRVTEAKRLVDARQGTNLSWDEWCESNVRKRDGTPYSTGYIYELLDIGRAADPAEKLAEFRNRVRLKTKKARVPIGGGGTSAYCARRAPTQKEIDLIMRLKKEGLSENQIAKKTGRGRSGIGQIIRGETKSKEYYAARVQAEDIQGQINQLILCWERATPEARRRFLHEINARMIG